MYTIRTKTIPSSYNTTIGTASESQDITSGGVTAAAVIKMIMTAWRRFC